MREGWVIYENTTTEHFFRKDSIKSICKRVARNGDQKVTTKPVSPWCWNCKSALMKLESNPPATPPG